MDLKEEEKFWPMYGVIDPLIIHETGHEWFGNSVTASDPTHIWIHEGLQVYSESIYFEDKFDTEAGVHYLNTIKNRIANEIPNNKEKGESLGFTW